MVPNMGRLVLSLAFLASSAVAAADDDATAIENTFVKPWVAAMQSGDKAQVERFFHPASRACINMDTRLFFDTLLDRETSHDQVGRGPYHISGVRPMKGAPPALLPEDEFRYPVRPTYQVDVQFDDLVMSRFVAQVNGSWFEVYPCPDAKGIAFFRKQLAGAAERKKKITQMVSEMKDPLRTELKDLLRQQRKIDAAKKYSAAAGVDMGTAMLVIGELQRSKP